MLSRVKRRVGWREDRSIGVRKERGAAWGTLVASAALPAVNFGSACVLWLAGSGDGVGPFAPRLHSRFLVILAPYQRRPCHLLAESRAYSR